MFLHIPLLQAIPAKILKKQFCNEQEIKIIVAPGRPPNEKVIVLILSYNGNIYWKSASAPIWGNDYEILM